MLNKRVETLEYYPPIPNGHSLRPWTWSDHAHNRLVINLRFSLCLESIIPHEWCANRLHPSQDHPSIRFPNKNIDIKRTDRNDSQGKPHKNEVDSSPQWFWNTFKAVANNICDAEKWVWTRKKYVVVCLISYI